MLTMATLSYKQQSLEDNWDAIVIGSGIGGLTAAALLAKHGGKRVLVLERHYVAGGFTHVFHRPGYEWDVGVHYIGETRNPASPVRAAFDHLTEGRLKWNPMPDIYDEFRIGDQVYRLPSGAKRYEEMLKRRFPRNPPPLIATSPRSRPASGPASSTMRRKRFLRWPPR